MKGRLIQNSEFQQISGTDFRTSIKKAPFQIPTPGSFTNTAINALIQTELCVLLSENSRNSESVPEVRLVAVSFHD